MSIKSGFYDAVDHDRTYSAENFCEVYGMVLDNGIDETFGGKLEVTATGSSMKVNVASGRSWFLDKWIKNDALLEITIPASDTLQSRIDAIVIDVDNNDEVRAATIIDVQGTPDVTPSRPTLINNSQHKQYPLAYIDVNAGVTVITNDDITDVRGQTATPFTGAGYPKTYIDSMQSSITTQLNTKQNKTDNSLATSNKTIVGAINEEKTSIENVGTVASRNANNILSILQSISSINSSITSINTSLNNKANVSHNHDSRYYTEYECDNKFVKMLLNTTGYYPCNDLGANDYANTGVMNVLSVGNRIWALTNPSDERIKENIVDSRVNGLDIISALEPKEFDYIDAKWGEHTDLGFVAQNVEQHIPEAILDCPNTDGEGNVIGEPIKTLAYEKIVPYLIKAVQELQAEVEELKNGK